MRLSEGGAILFSLALVTAVVPFVISRGTIAMHAYQEARRTQISHAIYRDLCDSHTELREVSSDECIRRSALAELSPVFIALQKVLEKTKTCGNVDCTDLLGAVADKLNSTIFYVALAFFGALIAWVLLARIALPMGKTAVRNNIDRQNYVQVSEIDQRDGSGFVEAKPLRRLEYEEDFDARGNMTARQFIEERNKSPLLRSFKPEVEYGFANY